MAHTLYKRVDHVYKQERLLLSNPDPAQYDIKGTHGHGPLQVLVRPKSVWAYQMVRCGLVSERKHQAKRKQCQLNLRKASMGDRAFCMQTTAHLGRTLVEVRMHEEGRPSHETVLSHLLGNWRR